MANSFKAFHHALRVYWKSLFVVMYPLLLLPIFLTNNTLPFRCLYIVCLMGGFWCTEVLPLAVTSLIPVVLFPLMGIMDSSKVSLVYLKETNMMFIGGLILAIAVEHCRLHIRIALFTIKLVGCGLRRLNFGLVTITMFISLWISNTAATAMMIPIIEATLSELELQGVNKMYEEPKLPITTKDTEDEVQEKKPTKVTMCFFVSTAYAATIGGQGCIIGSGTNLTYVGFLESRFPDFPGISFFEWMLIHLPLTLINSYVMYLFFQFWYMGLFRPHSEDAKAVNIGEEGEKVTRNVIKQKLKDMGPMSFHELMVAILFVLAIVMWLFRKPMFMPGWAEMITDKQVKDACPAIIICIFLFTLPSTTNWIHMFSSNKSKRPEMPSPPLITWKIVQQKMPWGLIFLLGGGFAIAEGSKASGMSHLIAITLKSYMEYDKLIVLTICCVTAIIITQLISSNVATANILLPIVAEIAVVNKIDPIYLTLPVTACCSYAYLLPVSTPPNALAANPCHMPVYEMMKVGFWIALFCTVAAMGILPWYAPQVLHLDGFPDWASN